MYENCLKGKVFEYPIYIDIESNIPNTNYNEAARGFCDYIESVGGYAGIYCNLATANSLLNYNELSKDYDFWLAYWGSLMPNRNKYGNYGIWQFGGNTNLIRSNIIGGLVCDQDYAYKDYPEIMVNKNLNNFTEKQQNVLTYLDKLPDLVISFDYQTNAIFLNKISTLNTPIICITDLLNTNIITKQMYYLLINNKSLYINIILIYIFFNSIKNNKKTLGIQFM